MAANAPGNRAPLEPVRERGSALNDLLDRLLTKGIILDLDLVIGVAGIPLIGVSLRAAIAAIETMIEYGLLQTWDEKTREYTERELQKKKLAFGPNEDAQLEMFGSHWYSDGVYRVWRPGRLFLTQQRLILYRRMPPEILFELPLASIRGMSVAESIHFNGHRVPLLHFVTDSGKEASLYAEDISGLESALNERFEKIGVLIERTEQPCLLDREVARIAPEARILADGPMWRQAEGSGRDMASWQAGRIYLTDQGLLWWSDSRREMEVRIPVRDIISVGVEPRDLASVSGVKSVLGIRYRLNEGRLAVLFSGKNLDEWRTAIRSVVVDYEGDLP